jgi:hypothetical protein
MPTKGVEPEAMTQIRMKVDIGGLFHNYSDIRRGQIATVETRHARRYYLAGLAQPASEKELGKAYEAYTVI